MTSSNTEPMPDGANLSIEEALFSRGYAGVIGMDEVGRGSLAGPVTVGASWVPAGISLEIAGLTDSKALSPRRREAMVPEIRAWADVATGSAGPEEIDALGMTEALRLAGQRALGSLTRAVGEGRMASSAVLLDGKHDWLTRVADLFSVAEADPLGPYLTAPTVWDLPVTMQIKGDFRCASIAAASVVAKVERDAVMDALSVRFPVYGWEGNKGYGSASHREALRVHGPCAVHRLSWSLGATTEQLRHAWGMRG